MTDNQWVDGIAGSYIALWLTMWITGSIYIYRWAKHRKAMDIATLVLYFGIGCSFLGHAIDQSFWAVSNAVRAVGTESELRASAWYAENIPMAIILGKYVASLGAFCHLHIAVLSEFSHSIWLTIFVLSSMWAAIVAMAVFFF